MHAALHGDWRGELLYFFCSLFCYLLQEAEAHLADVNQRFSAQFEIVRDLMSECDRKNTEQVMTKHTLGRTASPCNQQSHLISNPLASHNHNFLKIKA